MLARLPAAAVAQPVGSEFQINTYTTSNQGTSVYGGYMIASDASGNFVVVWTSLGQDGSSYGIFGQRYDGEGAAMGAEFLVNSFTTSSQRGPSVASDASGNFVVIWISDTQDGSLNGIFGQRYDSGGVALGSEFRVNSYTTGAQTLPSVASDASGNFVVAWISYAQDGDNYGIFAQRYDSGGGAVGSEFRVNSYTTSNQQAPSVASDGSGNFVVAWGSWHQDGSYLGVFGQRYDSSGMPQGTEFRVNAYTTWNQQAPSVAFDADGNFVVVWHSDQDGHDSGIFGQRYDGAGAALGSEFRVNSYTTGSQTSSSVAFDASGSFVVVWHSNPQDGSSYGVFGQRYDGAGVVQGNEFQINSYTIGRQQLPAVKATGASQFVVAWDSYGQDGSGRGVFGRLFDFGGPPSLSISDVSLNEGNVPGGASGRWAVFAVTLSTASTQPVAIDYTTANGTGMAPSDYTARSGTLTLSPGQTSTVIAVKVREDNVVENDETFFVNLSNPVNATIADGQGMATILNDDP